MANEEQQISGEQEETKTSPTDWKGRVEQKYLELKEHAETYPYVWASYIVVYGGFSLWAGYRWIKLRKTETRVQALQERLRKLVEAEESAASSSSSATQIEKSATDKSH